MLYFIILLLFFLKNLFFNLLVESKNIFFLSEKNIFLNKINKNLKLKYVKKEKKICKFNIVIDPGHGGYDPGAIGFNGSKEKDITLLISKKLFYFLNLNKKFKVFLVRYKDNYVSLKDRLRIVRIKNANLLLSIHVNSIYKNKYIKGASIWFNKYKYINNIKSNKLNNFLFSIINEVSKLNLNLALEIINKFRNVVLLHKNYLQYDNLFILSLFYIPSILIEVGYISNPIEEKKLINESYQYQLAKYIYLGINNFVNKLCILKNK